MEPLQCDSVFGTSNCDLHKPEESIRLWGLVCGGGEVKAAEGAGS